MRRMGARSPQFTIIGVAFIGAILCYNLWVKSSFATDLQKEVDRLQSEVKLSAAKQVDYEQKAIGLHNSVSDVQTQLEEAKKQLDKDKTLDKKKSNFVKIKENEILNLRNEKKELQEKEIEYKQQLEEKETEIFQLKDETKKIKEQKNDLLDIVSERDQEINKIKMQYEQAKEKLKMDGARSILAEINEPSLKVLKNDSNVDGIQIESKGLSGHKGRGLPLLPQDSPNAIRSVPRFSVQNIENKAASEGQSQLQIPVAPDSAPQNGREIQNVIQNPEVAQNEIDSNIINQQQHVLQKPIIPPEQLSNEHNVLKPPDKHLVRKENLESNVIPMPNLVDNPDRAIDEDEQVMEDPGDDQDEEGKDIKNDLDDHQIDSPKLQNFNQIEYEDGNERNGLPKNPIIKGENPEPRGIGKMEIPRNKESEIDDYVNVEGEAEANILKANDHLFEANINNKLRNMRLGE